MKKMRGFAAAYRAAKMAEKQQKELSWEQAFKMGLFMFGIMAIPILIFFLVSLACNGAQ
jgi:hypothetical protein